MSGIYIPYLEMPKDGAFVEVMIWSDGHVTKTGDSYIAENGRRYYKRCDLEYFPAIPVPDHGRLIDADALRQDWLENGENAYVYDTNSFLYSIDEAETIIPAEKEDE